MNSNTPGLGKSLSIQTPPAHSPVSQPSPATSGFDSARRPTSQSTSSSQPTPRKGQAARKQHRNQRRPFVPRGGDMDDDDMAELSAVRNASSRRGQTSITHLLNYSLGPRPYDQNYRSSSYSRSYRRNPTWGPGSGHHAADKARYVHANYRFVVSPKGNYRKHATDADELLEWSDVLQVLASSESQAASCPICLSEPVAPRMAKCGHIFCLPCLIRFMNSTATGDDNATGGVGGSRARWKKCPICEDSVYMHEVRPVRFYAGQESPLPRPGDDVVLRLMMRPAKSTLALPRETDMLNVGHDVPWHFAANVLDYAHIIKGTGDYMVAQHDEEIEALKKQEKEDELLFHEDGEWTQRAVKAINAAKEKLADLGGLEVALPSLAGGSSSSNATNSGETDFYFYSALPHLYLSPLDIRILKTKYGSFSAFPSTLLPKVEHISTGHAVDDAVRRRARYLGHLPRGCLTAFLECDWTDIVPAEILASFADEIERRRKRNRDKAAQEERERLQAERIEAATLRSGARRTTLMPATEEEVVFRFGGSHNAVNLDEFLPLGAGGSTPPNARSGFLQLADLSTSPSAPRTVWGTPALVQASAGPELGRQTTSSSQVDDGWLKDEQVLGSLGGGAADLATRMEGLIVDGSNTDSNPAASPGGNPGSGGSGGKKKKKQKITLMSTGGRRGN